MKKQHIWVPVVLLLVLLWGAFSWRWYTCGVKGFCDNNREVPQQQESAAQTPAENPAPEMPDLTDPKYWQKG